MASEQQCKKALEVHEKRLAQLPEVVGLGIVSLDDSDPASADLAVGVYVSSLAGTEEKLPSSLAIKYRRKIRDVPVRVIEQGEVALESGEGQAPLDEFGRNEPIGKEPL